MRPIRRILVATDFSASSLHALESAIELAAGLDASLLLVHAYRLPSMGATDVGRDELAEAIAAAADYELRRVVQSFADRHIVIEPVVRQGWPEEVIPEVAEQMMADLIVLGAHDRRRLWNRIFHGNVATKLVRRARTPILTIHDDMASALEARQ